MVNQRKKYRKKSGRAQVYGKAAYQLYKDVRMLKDVINVEHRYSVTQYSDSANTDSVANSYVDQIVEGTDFNNRSGNQMKVQRISGRVKAVKGTAYDAITASCRFIIFIDKPAEFGADTATWRKIMDTGPVGYEILANKQGDLIKKTKVLLDKTIIMTGDAARDAASVRTFDFNIPINRITRFDESEAVTLNDIKYMIISDQPTATTYVTFRQQVKVSWTDN